MRSKFILLSLALGLLAACTTPEQHYQLAQGMQAARAAEAGEKQKAELIYHLTQAAEAGNARACYDLAYVLLENPNKPLDQADFAKWLHKAAALNLPEAQFELGIYQLYQHNTQEGLGWLEKAAATGNPRWQLQLSRYYCCSNYVPLPNMERSFHWALAAAKAGLVEAMSHVGYCYSAGLGVAKDNAKAVHWMEKAADAGDAYSQNNLGICYEYGLGVEADSAKAIYWYEKAIKNDFLEAHTNLAVLYVYTAPKPYYNPAKGFALLQRAAARGHLRAMSVMGECYQFGVGVKRDLKQAFYWQNLAHEKGYYIASYYLGRMYLEGVGVPQDTERALKLFTASAAEETWGGAACAIGDIYLQGTKTINKNYDKALLWYTQAARQNNQRAMYQLGRMYENGLGVGKNPYSARGWYEKALSLNAEELRASYTEQSLSSEDPVALTTKLCRQALARLPK